MKKNWVVSILLLVVVGAVSFHFYRIQRVEKDIRDIRKIPMEIGEWTANDIAVSDHDYEILETKNLALRHYRNKKGESVDLFVIYSETNRRVCHPPVVCLIGSGLSVTRTTQETLSFPGRTFTANRLLAGEGTHQYVVLFWYMLDKEFTHDYLTQQLRWVIKQATGKGIGGAMVRIITPISKEETEEAALARAKRFIEELIPLLTQNV